MNVHAQSHLFVEEDSFAKKSWKNQHTENGGREQQVDPLRFHEYHMETEGIKALATGRLALVSKER